MKAVIIPGVSVLAAIAMLAAAVVWFGLSSGTAAVSGDGGDGYYITEFRRTVQ